MYIGTEQEQRKAFTQVGSSGPLGFGYGSPLYNNTGCPIELSASPCTPANTSGVTQGTVGFWWRWLTGPYGTMATGAQYSYTRRNVFSGAGGTPKANENIFMLSMHYYPFQ